MPPRPRVSLAAVVGIGVVVGLVAALFGVGGGIVAIPLLIGVLKLAPKAAAATSLSAIGVTALLGIAVYAPLDRVDWAAAATIGLPGAVGAFVGTALQRRMSSRTLILLFSGIMVAVAIRLLLE